MQLNKIELVLNWMIENKMRNILDDGKYDSYNDFR